MDKNLVSVIMPAFNAEAFIVESVRSVIVQTYQNWELIIVDDGSTDGTAEIVARLQSEEPRIKYFYQENAKQGKARNLGIKESSGNYIAFLDADDLWTPEKLCVQMNVLKHQQGVDLIFSQGYIFDKAFVDCNIRVKDLWDIDDLPSFLHHNQVPVLSVIIKKDALLNVNGFTEKPEIQNAEDYHLWLKLLLYGYTFKSIATRLFFYRIHEQQSTFQNRNIDKAVFYTFLDIYHLAENTEHKKLLLHKLKWYLFKNEFHTMCIELFEHHLKQKRVRIIPQAIRFFLTGNSQWQKKTAFHLLSIFA